MFFFPQVIEEKQSAFNGTIKVYKLFGHYSLSVDHLTQSGGLVKNIWHKGLKKITQENRGINNVLILGFGAGTAAKLVNQFWPEAKIIGIEIDKAMTDLGKKYLGLRKIQHLTIINADAFLEVYKLQATSLPRREALRGYKLILVDLYHGKSFPHPATTLKFAQNLKRLLHPQGILIINRLNYAHNEQSINHHLSTLKRVFPHLISQKILSNVLVFCSLQE